MKRLGSRQIETLVGLASPAAAMVIGNAVIASLERHGLVKAHDRTRPAKWPHGTMVQITPAGLREIADQWEAGRTNITPPTEWDFKAKDSEAER